MSKLINIALVGLGQVGNYLLNELNTKKKILSLKQVRKLMWWLFLQEVLIKNENSKLIKKYFTKIL